jgi:hypothetical protein
MIDDVEVAPSFCAAGEWPPQGTRRRGSGSHELRFLNGFRFMVKGFDRRSITGSRQQSLLPGQFERCGFAPSGFWNSIEVRGGSSSNSLIARAREKQRLEGAGIPVHPGVRA